MTTATSPFGDIIFEPIPDAPPRPPGKGREPVKWEEHLAALETQLLDKPARLWQYENKAAATSRMSAVRSRLATAAPSKHWELKVRPVPNSTLFGVYAVFHGLYTPEEQQANAQARQRRQNATTPPNPATTPSEPASPSLGPTGGTVAQTPKEKLAAKAAGK